MPQYMFDGAYSPDLAECKRRGAVAMSHYMTRSYASTSAQPRDIRAHGMGVLLNWEGNAADLVSASRGQGRSFAQEALRAYPSGAPRNGTVKIFYSVDTDVTNLAACDEAFRGINDAHRGTGIGVGMYGEGALIERLHGMGLVTGGQWLSMSEGFGGFSRALHSGLVAVVQMHDAAGNWIGSDVGGTDRNTVLDAAHLGAWWPDGHPLNRAAPAAAAQPKPAPVTATVPEEPMASIVLVDPKECTRRKIRQPGYFLDIGDMHPRHIPTVVELSARIAQGLTVHTLSLAQARAIGVK